MASQRGAEVLRFPLATRSNQRPRLGVLSRITPPPPTPTPLPQHHGHLAGSALHTAPLAHPPTLPSPLKPHRTPALLLPSQPPAPPSSPPQPLGFTQRLPSAGGSLGWGLRSEAEDLQANPTAQHTGSLGTASPLSSIRGTKSSHLCECVP